MKISIKALCIAAVMTCCVITGGCRANEFHSSVPVFSESVTESNGYTVNQSLSDEKITLTVWESAGGVDEWIKQAGEGFNEIYPNITIEYVNVEIDKVVESLKKRSLTIPNPDLFGAPHDRLSTLIENNYIVEIKNYEEISATTLTTASNAMFSGGKMYGYPTSCETYALFYNKKLITEEEVPDTWEEVIAYSKEFSELFPGKYGFMMDNENMYYVSSLFTDNNNRLLQNEQVTGLLTNSAVKGTELLKEIVGLLPDDVAEYDTADFDNMFLNGNAAMYVSGPRLINAANTKGLSYGVTTLPSFTENGIPALSFSGVRGMFVSAMSAHPEEAAEFAKYLISEEMQILRHKITGALPSINIAVENNYADAFINQLAYSYPMPKHSSIAQFWKYGEDVFTKAMYENPDSKTELIKYNRYLLTGSAEETKPETTPTETDAVREIENQ